MLWSHRAAITHTITQKHIFLFRLQPNKCQKHWVNEALPCKYHAKKETFNEPKGEENLCSGLRRIGCVCALSWKTHPSSGQKLCQCE
ncbi:hypothetical protein CHARACLAT_007115 [Characodon lateralis]|uniref:Uncharacterized protein n=1 Tax=Characodon lateralis TaxID=208331 RepID=A0ABU7F164_9TELE|nr:hypothetical protein [Characodon lateralis]